MRAIIVSNSPAAAVMRVAVPTMPMTEEMQCEETYDQDDPDPVTVKPVHCLPPKYEILNNENSGAPPTEFLT